MKINNDKAVLVIFNMQMELIPLLENSVNLTHNCVWLADLFNTLDLPIVLTDHKKLGKLAPPIMNVINEPIALVKENFSIVDEQEIMAHLEKLDRKQVIIAGAESHVCIYQSAVDLLGRGYEVFVLADSVSARNAHDQHYALKRLDKTACQLITQDMMFFELIRQSERPDYLDLALKFLDGRYIR